ncbi:MAG: Nitrilase/cyanide hydratase and apolipoprotein N-acyltransferase, partial [Bacteroidetes bacterium]|nr:Nitrilase/cyanide hydratase and apolipoprotein N-acyltransferase [Bacteroidota bacterium]
MKATLIQTSLHWEDRKKNLTHFDSLVDSVKDKTDLVILPEMFTTGFTMNPERLAEPADGETSAWMKKKASEKNFTITGSVAVEENGKYYNRLLWASPDKTLSSYDKRHLFRMAKEDQHYTAGKNKLITKVGDWKICPLVCYDLRFPVWCRNKFSREKQTWDYDVLIFV